MNEINKIIMKPGLGYFDKPLSEIILKTLPFWEKVEFTPNKLTTLGLISSFLSIYYIINRNASLAILFLILRWYFDYADGLFARKYDQVTLLGEYYDHITDMLYAIFLIYVLFFTKYPSKTGNLKIKLIISFFIFATLYAINYSCIEREYYDVHKNNSLVSIYKHLCPVKYNYIFKIFDNSVFYIILIIIIHLFIKYNPK
jgi:phosphatidylglycerophosphate synthase